MKKGFRGEGRVERVDFPNKGIVVTEDGEQVIVKNSIPGQKVSFGVNKVKHGKAEGPGLVVHIAEEAAQHEGRNRLPRVEVDEGEEEGENEDEEFDYSDFELEDENI